jgi:hypothetical protein
MYVCVAAAYACCEACRPLCLGQGHMCHEHRWQVVSSMCNVCHDRAVCGLSLGQCAAGGGVRCILTWRAVGHGVGGLQCHVSRHDSNKCPAMWYVPLNPVQGGLLAAHGTAHSAWELIQGRLMAPLGEHMTSGRWAPAATLAVRTRVLDRGLHAGLKTSNSIAEMASTSGKVRTSSIQDLNHSAKVTCARRCHLRTFAGFDFYVRRR